MPNQDSGFTVHDRRRVNPEGEAAEAAPDRPGGEEPCQERETERPSGPLPPVDFSGFVLGLGQMALMQLGEIPDLQTGKPERDLEQARHTIDTLSMLEEKTRGNLTEDEQAFLHHLLTELRMRYVRLAK
jgi:hypothetical protein